ncbi:MAG: Rpn family recombination-promoting nuclease/putative transposase [Polyangiaceae bacterium]
MKRSRLRSSKPPAAGVSAAEPKPQRRRPRSSSPHDALFKHVFGRPEHASAFLRDVAPADLAAFVDWSSLKRRPGSFVNEELREQHTDLLFSATLRGGSTCFFYFLFEHQSTADPWMLLRLLEYMTRIWRDFLAKQPKATRLPAILPVVLHHSDTGWTCATELQELLDLGGDGDRASSPPGARRGGADVSGAARPEERLRAAVAPYTPSFRILLNDVSHTTDEELRSRAISALDKLVLACFRHARDMRALLVNLAAWSATFTEVRSAPDGMRAIAYVLRYMFGAARDMEPDEVRVLVEGMADPVVSEEIVSLAKKLKDQGRQEGRVEGRVEGQAEGILRGRLEGRAETVLKQLRLKFRRVPASVVARVKSGTEADLDRWTERVLTADSLAAVIGD